MRTTLDLDDDLMERLARRYPAGTPKTVILEDAMRRSLASPAELVRSRLPSDVADLVARGLLVPPARSGLPPQSPLPPLPPGTLLVDLAQDREDR